MLPKETPDDIVQAYRDAAKKMAADPEVIAFIHSALGKYDTIVDNVDKAMQTATHVSPEAEKFILGWLKARFGFEPKEAGWRRRAGLGQACRRQSYSRPTGRSRAGGGERR